MKTATLFGKLAHRYRLSSVSANQPRQEGAAPGRALSFRTHTALTQSLYDVPSSDPHATASQNGDSRRTKRRAKKTWGWFKIPKLHQPRPPFERPAPAEPCPAAPQALCDYLAALEMYQALSIIKRHEKPRRIKRPPGWKNKSSQKKNMQPILQRFPRYSLRDIRSRF